VSALIFLSSKGIISYQLIVSALSSFSPLLSPLPTSSILFLALSLLLFFNFFTTLCADYFFSSPFHSLPSLLSLLSSPSLLLLTLFLLFFNFSTTLPTAYFFPSFYRSLSLFYALTSPTLSTLQESFSTSMESEEKNIAEERRKQARENSRVSEIVNSSVQPEATADNQDDNELFVAQEPAPKRARRVPCLTLTNKEIRKSINVGLHETGSSTAAPKSNSLSGFMTPKESSSRPKGKPKSKANEVDLDTLFNSDIIRDGQANAQSAPVPTFTQGNKNKALSELIASVPVASQDEAKPDKQAVLDATKKFRPLIRSDKKGGWKHRDLKTSLYHHQVSAQCDMLCCVANLLLDAGSSVHGE
jgi:hypothetical protein